MNQLFLVELFQFSIYGRWSVLHHLQRSSKMRIVNNLLEPVRKTALLVTLLVQTFLLPSRVVCQEENKISSIVDCNKSLERMSIDPYLGTSPEEVHKAFLNIFYNGDQKRFDEVLSYLKKNNNALQKNSYGLTGDEMIAISSYIGGGAYKTNQALREKSQELANLELTIRLTNSGLSKLPDFTGPVFRVTGGLPIEELQKYTPQNVITFDGFTSASAASNWMVLWGSAAQVRYTIISKHGKDVSSFNGKGNEHEVLFQSGTRFRVLSTQKSSNGSMNVTLEEK